ncbi:MAG: DUF3696 domain-containing protein [Chlamydiae bacterium]|nr:DUF3696 domain-containing protein [Chlamydiota bacterium]
MQPFGGALKRLDRYLKDEPEPVDNRDIDSIMVYYFDNKDMQSYPGATNVKNMRLDSQGRLIDDWPGGFFEEGVREVLI